MTAPAAKAPRPLRRDAAENRDRLLTAAGEVFDARGLDAGVAEIARAAGVGMGTLYRRFPTKDALIDALVEEILDTMIGLARDAAALPGGTGLVRFLQASSVYHAEHPGCVPRLWDTGHDKVREARQLIAGLLADAQRHGEIRNDVTPTDLTLVSLSVRGILEATRTHAPDAWQRHLELLVAGLRPGSGPLEHPPLSRTGLDAVLTAPAARRDG